MKWTTDTEFHYFKTDAGRYYKLAEPEWRPANRDEMIHEIGGVGELPGPNEPGFEQYVAVKQGQMVLAPLP